jgi:hypothetical protein
MLFRLALVFSVVGGFLAHPYPNGRKEASEKAKKYHKEKIAVTVEYCEHYCGVWYGLANSGWNSAAEHWKNTPKSYKLPGWEEGAMALWTGGSKGFGHCAIGTPHGDNAQHQNVFSTDYPTMGLVGHVDAATITKAWGLNFKGWYKAYFPKAVFLNGTWLNKTTNLINTEFV